MDTEKFKQAVLAFTPIFHQDVLNYINALAAQGFTISDIKEYNLYYLDEIKQRSQDAIDLSIVANTTQECPECFKIMFLYPVNITPSTQTGDPSDNSVWLCQNKECLHVIYNKETVDELKER